MIRLGAAIHQNPKYGQPKHDPAPPRVIEATGDNYDTALIALLGQLEDGDEVIRVTTLER